MKIALSFVTLGLCVTAAGGALAQPPEPAPYYVPYERPSERRLEAPRNALELSLGTGYSQGFGNLRSGVGMPSVVTPGAGLTLGVGYRIDPSWAVLWSGDYAELMAERSNTARTFTTGLALQYHLAPMQKVDPWVEVGAGYRFLIEDSSVGPNLLTHGFQLGRVRAGLDFRIADAVALGPMVGADATLFVFQDFPSLQTNISDPTISTFIFAGVQGRFDIGQSTSSYGTPYVTSASTSSKQ